MMILWSFVQVEKEYENEGGEGNVWGDMSYDDKCGN